MNFSAFVVLLPIVFDTALTLECFVCEANNEKFCKLGNPHLRVVHCGLEDTTFFWFCLYKVMNNSITGEQRFSYSCERMGRPGIFTRLPHCNPQEYEELIDCRVCLTDRCTFPNKSTNLRSDITVITLLILTYLTQIFLNK